MLREKTATPLIVSALPRKSFRTAQEELQRLEEEQDAGASDSNTASGAKSPPAAASPKRKAKAT